jgi:thiol-disulfide isomerase/thioredoxin
MSATSVWPAALRRVSLSLLVGLVVGLVGTVLPAQAKNFPAVYTPIVVEPSVKDGVYEFDLRPAQAKARQSKKALYVYLGAHNCPYCKRYQAFLTENATALVPQFAKDYLVVDLAGDLRATAKQVVIRTDKLHLPYLEFQKAIGDERVRTLTYPNVWLLDAEGKPLMQMPSGAGTFETVSEQLEILRLVN